MRSFPGKYNEQTDNMVYSKTGIFALLIFLAGLTACQSGRVKDIDGNSYKTVNIGNQVWMKENLKTTRYNDGTPIPLVTDNDSWVGLSAPAYCWYANDSANKDTYGALYNFYAVATNKLCPSGWHAASHSEWTDLVNYIGDASVAGDKLKEAGTSQWKSPNTNADNEFGFSALPGGYRSFNGAFNYLWIAGYWWSSTLLKSSTVYFWYMRYDIRYIDKFIAEKNNGFSIRCIKDQPEKKN